MALNRLLQHQYFFNKTLYIAMKKTPVSLRCLISERQNLISALEGFLAQIIYVISIVKMANITS